MSTKEKLIQYGPELVAHVDRRVLELERKLSLIADLLTARERTMRREYSGNTDASGNGTAQVAVPVRAGQEFSLHRLIVDTDAATFAAPVTGGSVEIRVNGQRVDGDPLTPVGLPVVFTASSSAGIFCREGDVLEVVLIASGSHSARFFGVAQGKIRRVPIGE